MLGTAPTYNALHRKGTIMGMPILPAFLVIMLGLFIACLATLLSFIPYFGFITSIIKADLSGMLILLGAVYGLHKFDPHAFALLFFFSQDGKNGERGCAHYMDR